LLKVLEQGIMGFYKKSFFTATVFAALFAIPQAHAQVRGSGLMVAPTRVELDDKARTVSLTLINNGHEPGTYRIKTINSIMTETGEKKVVEGETQENSRFADRMVRFAPRQISLKPGEQQTIRVSSRIPSKLEEGEYRTGLNFQWIPEPGEPDINGKISEKEGISVNIEFSFGITVPVIIRHGNLNASGKISKLELKQGKNLEITFEREGNRSLYGDISVFLSKPDGKEDLISNIKGIAVYVPNSRRIFTVELPANALVNGLLNGKLRVEYREPTLKGGKLIAEASIPPQ